MCGIGGIIGNYSKDEIYFLLNHLKHRGPDDKSTLFKEKYGCAFTRLSIIDIYNGNQPFYSSKKNSCIFVNGEIYNSPEISKFLKSKNYRISTKNDIEPLIYLYDYEGISFLKKLNGIFAGCLIDNNINKCYLFRDRWGVKPLYYGLDNKRLIYSSDISPIRKLFINDCSYSNKGLSSYLSNRFVKAPYTFFKNIYEVLPGELIVIDLLNGKIEKKDRFFNLVDEINNNKKLYTKNFDYKEWIELIDLKLNEAVKKQTKLKNKKGLFLSGGIDSALLLTLISNHSGSKLNTYTLINKQNKKDVDKLLSKKISKKYDTNHTEIEISAKIWLNNKNKAIKAFGQPFSHAFSTMFISNVMKNDLKLAYSGDGADELFGNYLSHRFASSLDFIDNNNLKKNDFFKSLLIQDRNKLLQFKKVIKNKKYWRYSLYSFSDSKLLKKIYNNFDNSNYKIYQNIISNLTSKTNVDKILEYEIQNELPNQILKFTDNLSMINGIETRVPYLDNEFVNVALSIPSNLKINHGAKNNFQTKYILKKMAAKYLDNKFIDRESKGFQIDTNTWMKNELSKDIKNVYKSNILTESLGFDQKYYNKILNNFYKGDISNIYEIWNLYCLGSWLLADKYDA